MVIRLMCKLKKSCVGNQTGERDRIVPMLAIGLEREPELTGWLGGQAAVRTQ